ncbi:MAG: hypothetical protein KDC18_04815 [Alphaproteobacteria bacterium]|nr:hypothetical protein [Alphaproteobacteria bacterium]MCB9929537.1 hypothetical protein [Alphaproteobacteria bacterium]
MPAPEARRPTRIVMPLQCDESSWAALEHAAAVAKALHAELRATFLEDLDVLAAASLPMTRSISYRSGRVGVLEPAQVEAQFRAMAARARQRLAALCREHALAWSFEVAARGPEDGDEETATHPDLLLVDRGVLRRRQNMAALLRLAARYDTVGVWDMSVPRPSRLILVHRGEAAGLMAAGELARTLDLPLEVLIPTTDAAAAEAAAASVREWLGLHRVAGSVVPVSTDAGDTDLALQAMADGPGTLVIFEHADLLRLLGG